MRLEQVVGGIIVPDSAKEKPQRDTVLAVGSGTVRDDGTRLPLDIKPGDTTATVPAQAIYREGARNVTAGANPTALKRGLDAAVQALTAGLARMSKPVSGPMIALAPGR